MSTHVTLDDLADLHVGEASDEVAAHVASCAECTARLAELEAALAPVASDLRALASLPVPEVPADVAARLDALRPPPTTSGTVVPLEAARSRRTTSWLPALGGLAAAAVLVTGGVLLVQKGGSSTSEDTAASASGASALPTSATGNDYAKDGKALTAALPGLLGGGPRAETLQAPAADAKTTTGSTPPGTVPQTALSGDPLARLREQDGLAACLAGLTDPGSDDLPLALDYAAFEGQPALVVVLPTSKADKVDVFVVGAQCDQADQRLLFYTRLSKP